uniref:Protein kinase domain-containing protein n=1 Tax=Periophthalmus magnuspinnatus TaxID=409849 RepID=A0A3B3ZNE0_9GOBI
MFSYVLVCFQMLEDSSPVDELMELTAQSLVDLEIQDRFNVIKEIGRGKYGRVLLVTHRCRGTPMALKVMPKASTQLQGFLREYCTCLHLSGHPGIVGLFGIVFRSMEHYCFAQELVNGRDLFSVIQPKVGIPESSVKRCALQVSSALDFIHSRSLVHRDVKPENVLLLDDRCFHVKLADFGLAQRRGAFIRFVSGTLPYSAPELCVRVLREGQVSAPPLPVEPSLDTWAFGVLLFCVLTGYFPWESCTSEDSFYQDWKEEGERNKDTEEEREEEVPPLWRRFTSDALQMFRRLLALDPEQRSSVTEVKAYVLRDWLKPAPPIDQTSPTTSHKATSSLAPPTETSSNNNKNNINNNTNNNTNNSTNNSNSSNNNKNINTNNSNGGSNNTNNNNSHNNINKKHQQQQQHQ